MLVALPGFALWGATSTYRTGVEVRRSTKLNDIYEQARYAVGAEESLERKYRLEPGPEVRARHSAAAADMVEALQRAARMGDQAERQLIQGVLAKHEQYLDAISRMFAAVDAHDTAAATAIDSGEIDPSFDAIEAQVVAMSDQHRANAAAHLDALTAIQTRVVVATPVVFAFGAALVIFFWRLLSTLQRRAKEGLARETSNAQTSERRFRGMVLNTPDLILVCAAPGTVTYQSPAAETTWGYPAAELVGEPVVALAHPDDQAAVRDLWEQLRDVSPGDGKDATRTTELRLRDGAGTWRQAELIATNLLHDAAVQGIVVTVRDVTERVDGGLNPRKSGAGPKNGTELAIEPLVARSLADRPLSMPKPPLGGGRRPAFTGAYQPATIGPEVGGWMHFWQLSSSVIAVYARISAAGNTSARRSSSS